MEQHGEQIMKIRVQQCAPFTMNTEGGEPCQKVPVVTIKEWQNERKLSR